MVYKSEKPPQTKEEKNKRERQRYGGIADLIMQIRAELGVTVKFHAPILTACLETITRLQDDNSRLDMDISTARKLLRDRQASLINPNFLLPGNGPNPLQLAPGSIPIHNGAIPPGFSNGQGLQRADPFGYPFPSVVPSPSNLRPPPPGHCQPGPGSNFFHIQADHSQEMTAPREEIEENGRFEQEEGKPTETNNYICLDEGQPPALPAHRPLGFSERHLPPAPQNYSPQLSGEASGSVESPNNRQEMSQVQLIQSVPGKMARPRMAIRPQTSPYFHPGAPRTGQQQPQFTQSPQQLSSPNQQSQYPTGQAVYQIMERGRKIYYSPGPTAANSNLGQPQFTQPQQQQAVESTSSPLEGHSDEFSCLQQDGRPPSASSSGYYSFEDSRRRISLDSTQNSLNTTAETGLETSSHSFRDVFINFDENKSLTKLN